MRLSVRWQLVLVLVTLSLVPMALVRRGRLPQRARRARPEHPFQPRKPRVQTEERLERLLLDRQVSLRGWSQLRLIQDDTVTGDADGRILQFLQDAKRNFELQELWVANAAGPGDRVDDSRHARPRGRRPAVVAGRAPRRGVGRRARDAGVHQARRHAARRAAPRELRSVAKVVGVLVEVIDWPKMVETLQGVKVAARGAGRTRLPAARRCTRHRAERAAVLVADGKPARRSSARSASTRSNRVAGARQPAAPPSTSRDASYPAGLRVERAARRSCPASGAWRCCCGPTSPSRRLAA